MEDDGEECLVNDIESIAEIAERVFPRLVAGMRIMLEGKV